MSKTDLDKLRFLNRRDLESVTRDEFLLAEYVLDLDYHLSLESLLDKLSSQSEKDWSFYAENKNDVCVFVTKDRRLIKKAEIEPRNIGGSMIYPSIEYPDVLFRPILLPQELRSDLGKYGIVNLIQFGE